MPVDGIRRAGRATQGMIVMRLREGEQISSLAPVMETDRDVDVTDGSAPAPVEPS
jgi:hypothetical protein